METQLLLLLGLVVVVMVETVQTVYCTIVADRAVMCLPVGIDPVVGVGKVGTCDNHTLLPESKVMSTQLVISKEHTRDRAYKSENK
jgi:hypothetical protein